MAFDRRNLSGLDLDVAGDQMSLVADEPGKWRIVKPRALRADAEMVADFLEKLEGAKAIEFADNAPKSLAPYGLDKPWRVTLVTGKDKDRARRALLIGKAPADFTLTPRMARESASSPPTTSCCSRTQRCGCRRPAIRSRAS